VDDAAIDYYINTNINKNEAKYILPGQDAVIYGWVNAPNTDQYVSSSAIYNYEDNMVDPLPHSLDASVVFTATALGSVTDAAIFGIYVEFENDSNAQPATYNIELNGRHPQSSPDALDWTPQDENESCSAWVMKQQICENTNRIMQETRGAYSIPMYDEVTFS
jgi:hypothetical protein